MITDNQLALSVNVLGTVVFLLIIAYHYVQVNNRK